MDVPDPTGMEEAEQLKEAAREMPEDVSLPCQSRSCRRRNPGSPECTEELRRLICKQHG